MQVKAFQQPELARTLERIAANPDEFYHGKMAQELVDDLKKGGALITLEDLAQYNVVERQPIVGTFHNYTIISAPPPSSGGIVLLSALNILESYDLAGLGDRSAAAMHLITEAYRRAYMDRSDYLGDPDFNEIPVAQLTAKDLRRSMAQEHPARQGNSQRGLETSARISASCANYRRQAPRIARHNALLSCRCGGRCGVSYDNAE